jgi:hypothetical protein
VNKGSSAHVNAEFFGLLVVEDIQLDDGEARDSQGRIIEVQQSREVCFFLHPFPSHPHHSATPTRIV